MAVERGFMAERQPPTIRRSLSVSPLFIVCLFLYVWIWFRRRLVLWRLLDRFFFNRFFEVIDKVRLSRLSNYQC